MNLEEYQKLANTTSLGVEIDKKFVYTALGLASEAGEVAGKVKKIYRDNKGVLDEERKKILKKELGDVLWYVAQLCTDLDLSLDEVAQFNIDKLSERKKIGTIHGDGDDR